MTEDNNNNNEVQQEQQNSSNSQNGNRRLNEIWFDTFHRNNGTPSSPSNSDQGSESSSQNSGEQQQQEEADEREQQQQQEEADERELEQKQEEAEERQQLQQLHEQTKRDNKDRKEALRRKRPIEESSSSAPRNKKAGEEYDEPHATPSHQSHNNNKEEEARPQCSSSSSNNSSSGGGNNVSRAQKRRRKEDHFRRGYMSDDEGPYSHTGSSEENLKWSDESAENKTEEEERQPTAHQQQKQQQQSQEAMEAEPTSRPPQATTSKPSATVTDNASASAANVSSSTMGPPSASAAASTTAMSTTTTAQQSTVSSLEQQQQDNLKDHYQEGTTSSSKHDDENEEERKRRERNAREKERSNQISDQFTILRDLLTQAGVVVPKGTKASVLRFAVDYIRQMQSNQDKIEHDNGLLKQQIKSIGSGAIGGEEARKALQYAAQKNGLAGFEGITPAAHCQQQPEAATSSSNDKTYDPLMDVQEQHFPYIFHQAPIGMAVATLGGTLLDCNDFFCLLTNDRFTKDSVRQQDCSIFSLLPKDDLQAAFDRISELLTVTGADVTTTDPIVLRSSWDDELGLSISLVRNGASNTASNQSNDDDGKGNGIKHLLVTLVQRNSTYNNGSAGQIKHMFPACVPSIPSSKGTNKSTSKEVQAQQHCAERNPVFMVG